ncbi:MAG: hypothetical protein KKF65_04825 [Nanoarchaeota archaeon]|nr:hypothetical protein [Nanoarchaeota archaeon]
MADHGHDIHYILIVSIIAFFVVTLSVGQLNGGITANVVDADYSHGEGLLVNFLRVTARNAELRYVNSKVIEPVDVDTAKFSWKNVFSLSSERGNIGGQAVATPVSKSVVESKPLDCWWINLDNERFNRLKALSGDSACRLEGYDSCMMTNNIRTTTYFASSDGSCKQMVFKDLSNNFNNCDERIHTVSTDCFSESRDLLESEYTTVFCCS